MPTAKALVDHIRKSYKPEDPLAWRIWDASDVRDMAVSESCSENLTDEHIRDILEYLDDMLGSDADDILREQVIEHVPEDGDDYDSDDDE